jgi:uncharacterized protein (DUF305 family)
MTPYRLRNAALIVALSLTLPACGAAVAGSSSSPAPAVVAQLPTASEADVEFLTGMIHHHAQALVMAGWAESHGANELIQVLAERIIVSQRDEIAIIELWLTDHGIEPPELAPMVESAAGGMVHDHEMLMSGMLTQEQMAELDAARDAEFDRLFLTFMIQHHEGALEMVDTLFASHGGGVDDAVYKFASDTFADQGSEIDRMQRMLDAMNRSPQ